MRRNEAVQLARYFAVYPIPPPSPSQPAHNRLPLPTTNLGQPKTTYKAGSHRLFPWPGLQRQSPHQASHLTVPSPQPCSAPRLSGRRQQEHSGKAASETKKVRASDCAKAEIRSLAVQGQAVPVACRSERPRLRPPGRRIGPARRRRMQRRTR